MLQINDLTYRIEGRPIFDHATAAIPAGHKVGLVGRNGAGKTTLLKLISGELAPDDGSIRLPKTTRIGWVTQEAPGGPESLIEVVLAADTERAKLLAEAETATNPNRIAEIHVRLSDMDAHSAPSRAARILSGLGFDDAAQKRPCSEFSGGWRMRVALAAMLFTEPELLLLDEPSNYLDLEGTMWLEEYLQTYPHTVLIVSHDRDLLNKAVGSILHLSQGKLTIYTGGYDRFEEARREKQRLDSKLKKKQDDERKHIQAFVDRFKAKASKAAQAQSRMKALARMQPIAEAMVERVVPFVFPSPKRSMASPLVRLESAVAGYSEDVAVLKGLNLRLDHDDRVGLLGANGNGKSTFAKLISGRLKPMGGIRYASDKMTVGFFAQHQMDDLPPRQTPYEILRDMMPDSTEAQRRSKLGVLGFGYDKAETRAENLSGGEKARLLFAIATFHAPHLLILDEPTNHLDVDSREMLIRALADYEGAVILISHDRHLIEASADRLWIVRNGSVKPYEGDMESYRRECLAERDDPDASAATAKFDMAKFSGNGIDIDAALQHGHASRPVAAKVNPQEARRRAAEQRTQLAPLKKQLFDAELKVTRLTASIARIDAALGDTQLYAREPAKAKALTLERGQMARLLEDAEQQWFEISETYEAARTDVEVIA